MGTLPRPAVPLTAAAASNICATRRSWVLLVVLEGAGTGSNWAMHRMHTLPTSCRRCCRCILQQHMLEHSCFSEMLQ
jgi:hypothetical protein